MNAAPPKPCIDVVKEHFAQTPWPLDPWEVQHAAVCCASFGLPSEIIEEIATSRELCAFFAMATKANLHAHGTLFLRHKNMVKLGKPAIKAFNELKAAVARAPAPKKTAGGKEP